MNRPSVVTRTGNPTVHGSMMASQVNGGMMDIHTVPRATLTTTVASIP